MRPKNVWRGILADLHKKRSYHLNDFFNHFEFHKKRALTIYSRFQQSRSKGTDILFHSKKINQSYKKQLDAWMQQHLMPYAG